MFTRDNLPKFDETTGSALKTRPMLATVMLADTEIPAPWGGKLTGIAGYFNKHFQMFDDYHVVDRANEMSGEELVATFERDYQIVA